MTVQAPSADSTEAIPLTPDEVIQPEPIDPAVLERQKALKRFNMLSIYLPLGLVTLFVVVMFGLLTWASVFAGGEFQREYSSGISDIYIIALCLAPMSLICAIFPAAGVGALVWRRKKGSLVRKRVQSVAGKLDGVVAKTDSKAKEIQPKIAKPIIQVRSWMSYTATLLKNLRESLKELFS